MHFRRSASQTVLACLLSSALFAQQPQQPQQSSSPSVIRSTTRLVQVNVIVHDKNGALLSDLSRDDFMILDQGKPQQIAFFAEENGILSAAAKPLPPNTFSNRNDRTGQAPGGVTVVLFDSRNTQWEDIASARVQLIKFSSQLQPQDRVAVYSLGVDLRVLQDFTGDSSVLLKAIDQFKGSVASVPFTDVPQMPNTGTGVAKLDSQLEAARANANADYHSWEFEDRVRRTAAAMKAVADRLARIPGRKNLIWLSSSFPVSVWIKGGGTNFAREMRSYQPELDQVFSALLDANVAVYPIDPRGLIGPGYNAQDNDPIRPNVLDHQSEFDTMDFLAESTGGRAFYNGNDISGAVRKAIDDGQLTYQLAYHPDHNQWDGKFHRIQVKVNRPGVEIRARKGYFALPEPQNADTTQTSQSTLESATKSSVEFTDVSFSVTVRQDATVQQHTLSLSLNIAAGGLALAEKDGRWKGALDIVVVQRDAAGNAIDAHQWHWVLDLDKAAHDSALRNGLSVVRTVPAKPNAATTTVLVRDSSSNAIGSIIIPLKKLVAT